MFDATTDGANGHMPASPEVGADPNRSEPPGIKLSLTKQHQCFSLLVQSYVLYAHYVMLLTTTKHSSPSNASNLESVIPKHCDCISITVHYSTVHHIRLVHHG